jgi:hypothetical protein
MKKEIRGLEAGTYHSEDGTLLIRVSRKDDGVLVEIADMDADIFYAAKIDGGKAKFEWGNVTPSTIDDQGEGDGKD